MNKTQEHEILPMSKKDRRYRMPYTHFKNVKRKWQRLKKWQGLRAGSPREWNELTNNISSGTYNQDRYHSFGSGHGGSNA